MTHRILATLAASLISTTALAQPYAFRGEATITSIVDEVGWCAARPDGPRVGMPVSTEVFAYHNVDAIDFYRGDAMITIGNKGGYGAGIFYYPETGYVGGSGNSVSTFAWPVDGTEGRVDLAFDGIPEPPDLTGQGYPDCLVKIAVTPLVPRLFGDANEDGQFNSADFIQVFVAGEYEDDILHNSTWSEGDWNLDLNFRSNDLILALQTGKYEQSAAAVVVPEPATLVLTLIGLIAMQFQPPGLKNENRNIENALRP